MEGVRHLLDIVCIIIGDDQTRERVTNAGHELLRIYAGEHRKQIDRFIDSARSDFAQGVWQREPVDR